LFTLWILLDKFVFTWSDAPETVSNPEPQRGRLINPAPAMFVTFSAIRTFGNGQNPELIARGSRLPDLNFGLAGAGCLDALTQ